MSWWDSYKRRFADNVRHGAGDGLRAAASGRSAGDVARERRAQRLGRYAISEASLWTALEAKRAEYDAVVAAERARGNRGYPDVVLALGQIDGVNAVVRWGMNGNPGRVDVFYGGGASNPLDAPDGDYHGHIIILDGTVESWEEPGPKGRRNRLY